MSRKVFLSFLGLGKYEQTIYFFDQKKEAFYETSFVQEAILRYLISFQSSDVRPIIFITDEADSNWEENEKNKGLKNTLSNIDVNFENCKVKIASGRTEEEIWDVFNKVFDTIQEGDEIYFDITHGFRSLPMLAIVLLNYAKFLKNIRVCGIYYGAFDARELIEGKTWSPIWDLKSFSVIQDWTNAASLFLKTGNGLELSELVDENKYQILKESIRRFSKEILVNRGPDILKGETSTNIKEGLKVLDFSEKDPLKIILDKVKHHFDQYESNSIKNGLNAVKWCIDNGLIQQGATILEEFITTYALITIGKEDFLQDINVRSIVSSALSVGSENYKYRYEVLGSSEQNCSKTNDSAPDMKGVEKEIVPLVFSLENYKGLKRLVNELKKSIRDDINHAGFRSDPRNYDELRESLNKRYKQFLKLM